MKFIGMIAFLVIGSLLCSTNGVPVFRLEVSGSVNPLASLILAKGLAAKFSGLGLGAADQCNCIIAIYIAYSEIRGLINIIYIN